MWVQMDKPITRGLMSQLLYRAKTVKDNGYKTFTESLKPDAISFKYTDPKNNYTLTFPNSWLDMETKQDEFTWETDDTTVYTTGFDFVDQEMFQIAEYTQSQWATILEEDVLVPTYLGEKGDIVFAFSQAQDCVTPEMCNLMNSLYKIKNSFTINQQITLQAK